MPVFKYTVFMFIQFICGPSGDFFNKTVLKSVGNIPEVTDSFRDYLEKNLKAFAQKFSWDRIKHRSLVDNFKDIS